MRRALRRTVWLVGGALAVVVVAVVASARFGNDSLYPPPAGSPRIEVVIASNIHHSGIVLPRAALAEAASRHALPALAAVAARFEAFERLEFGWGDEGFYTRVPTSSDLTMTLALRALFRPGNPSVLHVVGLDRHPRLAYPNASMVALTIGDEGFARLAAAMERTFAKRGDAIEELGPGLYGPSRFYRAVGTFNILRVCNHWIADLLHAAGVPTAPVLATMPQGLLWDLSWRAGAVRLPAPPATL